MRTDAPTTATIAASYERVSTMVQGRQGFSLAAQHRTMEEFAVAQGWMLPEQLRFRDGEDENASGTRWDLPGQSAMLEAAQRREFSILIAPAHDRFARTLVKGLVLEEQLRKYGVRVVYQQVPVEDTPEGRLLKNQLYSFAEYEREKFILRSITGRQQKARSGRVVGQSVAPFGYRYTFETLQNGKRRVCGLEPDAITAPVVAGILSDLLTHSCADVAERLNNEGIETPRGKQWTARQVWRIAINPVYLGTYIFGGTDYDNRIAPEARQGIAVDVPALIERPSWDAIQTALERRKVSRRGRKPKDEDPYLLRGVLTCGHCHGAMHTEVIHAHRYYSCLRSKPYNARRYGKPVCDLTGARAQALEDELWRVVTTTLLDPDYLNQGLDAARSKRQGVDRARQERLDAIDTEVTRQRKRLDTLASRMPDAGDGEMYHALMRQARDIESLIEKLARERSDLAAVRTEGLSDAEVATIQQFALEIGRGLAVATAQDRRRIFDLLQIHGTVYDDPDGVKLTRRARFRIDWQAAIELRNSVTPPTRIGIPS